MSDFKLKFDQMRKNNLGENDSNENAQSQNENEFYSNASSTRNICFTLKDGKKTFLNYSYLVSCEYLPEENKISMLFTTHSVELKGERLEKLFEGLFFNSVMSLTENDERYNEIEKADLTLLNQILINLQNP